MFFSVQFGARIKYKMPHQYIHHIQCIRKSNAAKQPTVFLLLNPHLLHNPSIKLSVHSSLGDLPLSESGLSVNKAHENEILLHACCREYPMLCQKLPRINFLSLENIISYAASVAKNFLLEFKQPWLWSGCWAGKCCKAPFVLVSKGTCTPWVTLWQRPHQQALTDILITSTFYHSSD